MTAISLGSSPNTIFDRFRKLNWGIITILVALAFVGVLMHFSVSSGAWTEMPLTHGMRFAVLLSILLLSAMFLDTRFWLAIAYPLYAVALLLLVGVEVAGATRMGATRWLDIGPLSLQPSEIMSLDEYGLPAEIGVKLKSRLTLGGGLDAAITSVRVLDTRTIALSDFERDVVETCRAGL